MRPVCPEAPVSPVEPLAPASSHNSHTVSHTPPSLWKALRAPDARMHHTEKSESQPTCEARLPRSPGLAGGAARPCKQSPPLTLVSHAFPSLHRALTADHDCIHHKEQPESNPPVRPVCPEAPVSPVEPLAPASNHDASHSVTCLPFSVQSDVHLPCQYTFQWNARVRTHL